MHAELLNVQCAMKVEQRVAMG